MKKTDSARGDELVEWLAGAIQEARDARKRMSGGPPLELVVPWDVLDELKSRMVHMNPYKVGTQHGCTLVFQKVRVHVVEAQRMRSDTMVLRVGEAQWRRTVAPRDLDREATDTYLVLRGDGMTPAAARSAAEALAG